MVSSRVAWVKFCQLYGVHAEPSCISVDHIQLLDLWLARVIHRKSVAMCQLLLEEKQSMGCMHSSVCNNDKLALLTLETPVIIITGFRFKFYM